MRCSPFKSCLCCDAWDEAETKLVIEMGELRTERDAFKAANDDLAKQVKGWKEFGELATENEHLLADLGRLAEALEKVVCSEAPCPWHTGESCFNCRLTKEALNPNKS